MIDVSIVLVNYNVKEFITSSIQSIYEHTKPNIQLEVVVVDNNSSDGSQESIRSKFPHITLIRNNFNAGYSRAVNQAAKQCKGEYIFILNPDTLLTNDTISQLIKISKKFKNFGAIGPKLVSENGNFQQSFWEMPTISNTLKSVLYFNSFSLKKKIKEKNNYKTFKVKSLSGAAILVKKNVFKKLEGFNEDLFWMEDIDFFFRMKKLGYGVYFCPKTEIIHYAGKSAEKNYNVSISNQLMSKIKFFKIHHSKISASVVYLMILFISFAKAIVFLFFTPFAKKFRLKFIAYLYTTYSIITKVSFR